MIGSSDRRTDAYLDFSSEPNISKLNTAYRLLAVDPKEAIRQLSFLADIGSIARMIYIGHFYSSSPINKDVDQAEKWFRRAADAGSPAAYYSLGRLYLASKRFNDAKNAFEFAAARDFTPAIHFLGRMYIGGRGVEPNPELAQKLLGPV